MSYYHTCPHCGAHLDPSERCDCQDEERAPASASNADEGGAEQIAKPDSASIMNETEVKVK